MTETPPFDPIPPFDEDAARAARARQDRLTKPQGSLGRLEELTARLAGIQGRAMPDLDPAHIVVFAADHGVAARNVSAYPASVTAQMVLNYARGGAVINTLAAHLGARLTVCDVGVAADFPPDLPIRHAKVRRGTADWTRGPAMTADEARRALAAGRQVVEEAGPLGVLLVGEMGIGNTTTAAALAAALTGGDAARFVGRGTGVGDAGLARKRSVIEEGLARHGRLSDPFDLLAALGGLEIAAMTGAMRASPSCWTASSPRRRPWRRPRWTRPSGPTSSRRTGRRSRATPCCWKGWS
jgi:nicotinate-nucleotide--dimethylbenzimidazole phosphoribosyltransferase